SIVLPIKCFKTKFTSHWLMDTVTALLVQRRLYKEPNLLDEFEALATTAGYTVIGSFDVVSAPSARFGIRSGKADEIATWIEVNEPDRILFSPPLNSSQIFRLMELWKVEVRDRTQIILEIFDKRARTPQAKLQIEKARLSYEAPFERHQIRMRLQNERRGDGHTKDQVGAGEDLLSKRLSEIRKRITLITAKLDKIIGVQKLKKKKRSEGGFIEITLAGYTNAGKSTLHKALTGSDVEIADQLFTTLSTKAAQIPLQGRQIILSDSVGFISDLPPTLMQAFNTTLMEVAEADVIILVVDGSDTATEMLRKVDACLDTFAEIGASGIPIVTALNKIDLLTESETTLQVERLEDDGLTVVPISANTETNIGNLVDTVLSELAPLSIYLVTLPHGDSGMSILSWLHEFGLIKQSEYAEDHIKVEAELSLETAEKLTQMPDVLSISKQ
ncbi:MAG: GTPase HflX, partial [Candidatus Thorarchaeota archaeon]